MHALRGRQRIPHPTTHTDLHSLHTTPHHTTPHTTRAWPFSRIPSPAPNHAPTGSELYTLASGCVYLTAVFSVRHGTILSVCGLVDGLLALAWSRALGARCGDDGVSSTDDCCFMFRVRAAADGIEAVRRVGVTDCFVSAPAPRPRPLSVMGS